MFCVKRGCNAELSGAEQKRDAPAEAEVIRMVVNSIRKVRQEPRRYVDSPKVIAKSADAVDSPGSSCTPLSGVPPGDPGLAG